MRGFLAGGTGSRLSPITRVVSKRRVAVDIVVHDRNMGTSLARLSDVDGVQEGVVERHFVASRPGTARVSSASEPT